MEALVAVGLASNVLQFVDFLAKLIHISSELRNNAASSEIRDYQVTTTHLKALAQNISDSAKAISQSSTPATPEEKALQSVADECCKLADSLLGRLAKYSIQYSQNNSRLHRAKIAFKAIWNKKEIEEISNRLEFFRNQLTLYYAFQGRQTQLDQVARQSTTDDIQTILGRLENIKGLIESSKSDLGRTTNDQHLETLMSIKEARDENMLFYTQAAQRATADHSLVYRELGSLQSSMNKVTTNLQHTQIQQSQILESVAHAKVENSKFFATVTQQLPLVNDSSTLANAFQPLLEQYKDEFLVGVKKEFRSAARSAFNDMLRKTPATIDRMQHRSRAAQRVSEEVLKVGEDRTEKDLYTSEWYNAPSEEPKFLSLERRHFGQSDKNSVTIRYQNRLWWNTRLGCLMITIQDRDYFNEARSLTRRYELTVEFTPSPSWMSTGFSMTYENKTDARGSPEFGLRFKTYRILPRDHDIFIAMSKGDVRTVQNMLSQKLVLPSDRDDRGWSLLHYATFVGELDIFKSLVQSGTDINACCVTHSSVATIAVLMYTLMPKETRAIFHYILNLPGIDLSEERNLIPFGIRNLLSIGLEDEKYQEALETWASVWKSAGIVTDTPKRTFTELVVMSFHFAATVSRNTHTMESLVIRFDSIIQLKFGLTNSADPMDALSLGAVAFSMVGIVGSAFFKTPIAYEPSPNLSIPYRGYFLHDQVAPFVQCLDYIMLKKIARCSDCIFDTYDGITVSDIFYSMECLQQIWERILEDCGFDVDWVYAEDDRRKRQDVGESSTHDISVKPDTSNMLRVRRRQGYENFDE